MSLHHYVVHQEGEYSKSTSGEARCIGLNIRPEQLCDHDKRKALRKGGTLTLSLVEQTNRVGDTICCHEAPVAILWHGMAIASSMCNSIVESSRRLNEKMGSHWEWEQSHDRVQVYICCSM